LPTHLRQAVLTSLLTLFSVSYAPYLAFGSLNNEASGPCYAGREFN